MPTFLRNLVLGAVLVLTAGCASFHPRPLSPSETASAFEARTLDSPDLKKFLETNLQGEIEPWPPRVWDFRLLTLAAYYYHPDLDVARAQWGVARARILTAGARPNPSLQIAPEFSANPPAGVSPWTVGPLFDIPVETAGKRGYLIAQAQHLSAAARRKIAAAAWQVRSRLRRSLLDLYSANKRGTRLLGQDRAQADMVKLLEKRLAYGEIPLPVVTQAQISLERTRLSLEENRRRIGENQVRVAGRRPLSKRRSIIY
jgi:cobalt-zinc-cadmium efflux system outer membrane protein